nr:unnamed protein product [Digitaria exilis]
MAARAVVRRLMAAKAAGSVRSFSHAAAETGLTTTARAVVRRLMAAKAESGKTFSRVAAETGLTNVYVAQLLRRQAQLKPDTAPKLRAALPALTDEDLGLMMEPPFRCAVRPSTASFPNP